MKKQNKSTQANGLSKAWFIAMVGICSVVFTLEVLQYLIKG